MKQQQWTVCRRPVGHRAAQRRWNRVYQLLLADSPSPTPPRIPVSAALPGLAAAAPTALRFVAYLT